MISRYLSASIGGNVIVRDAVRCVVSDTHVIMNMFGASPAEYAGDKFSELIVLIWCRSQKK